MCEEVQIFNKALFKRRNLIIIIFTYQKLKIHLRLQILEASTLVQNSLARFELAVPLGHVMGRSLIPLLILIQSMNQKICNRFV